MKSSLILRIYSEYNTHVKIKIALTIYSNSPSNSFLARNVRSRTIKNFRLKNKQDLEKLNEYFLCATKNTKNR